jgi:hypothetical protein
MGRYRSGNKAVDKNKFPILSRPLLRRLSIFFALSILGTMLSTRAGLSISMMVFGAFALWGKPLKSGEDIAGGGLVRHGSRAMQYRISGRPTRRSGKIGGSKMRLCVAAGLCTASCAGLCSAKGLRVRVLGLLLAGMPLASRIFSLTPQAIIEGYAYRM